MQSESKKKLTAIKLICLLLILFLIFLYFDYTIISPVISYVDRAIDATNIDFINIGEMTEGTVISQSFTWSGYITSFQIPFATFVRDNYGLFSVELLIDNNLVFSEILSFSDLYDNTFVEFHLATPPLIVSGEIAELIISTIHGEPGSSVTTFVTVNSMVPGYALYINDLYQENSNLLFKIYGLADNTFVRTSFWRFAILLGVCIIFILFLLERTKVKPELIFVIFAGVIGFTYLFVIPPLSVPDEFSHIRTSYWYSNLIMGHPGNSIRVTDLDFGGFAGFHYHPRLMNYRILYESFLEPSQAGGTYFQQRPSSEPSYLYFISAFGITLARVLRLGTIPLLLMGSLFNLVFYIAVVYFAIKIIPFGKMIMFVVALLPMSIQQAASFSPDMMINALAFFFIAYILFLAYSKESVTIKDCILVIVLIALIAPTKGGVYLPLFLLCFFIPKTKLTYLQKINVKNKVLSYFSRNSFYFLVILVMLASFAVFAYYRIEVASTQDRAGQGGLSTYTLSYILSNPFSFIIIIINTLVQGSTFYFESTIGSFMGHLSIPIRKILVYAYLVLITITAIKPEKSLSLTRNDKLISIFIVLSSFGLTLVAMFLGWTPEGDEAIRGVQGRYFKPVIPLLLIACMNSKIEIKANLDKAIILSVCILQLLTVLNIFEVVINR